MHLINSLPLNSLTRWCWRCVALPDYLRTGEKSLPGNFSDFRDKRLLAHLMVEQTAKEEKIPFMWCRPGSRLSLQPWVRPATMAVRGLA